MKEDLITAQQAIGYQFHNPLLLQRALTHSSYANENRMQSNERLEFLGDSVLSIIVSDYIFHKFTKVDEGILTKLRAALVCEQSLAEVAKKIQLGNLIFLGHGEENTGGRHRPSVVSDAFEAVLASIYLDGGMDAARQWLLRLMSDEIEDARQGRIFSDYKSRLQETCQKGIRGKVTYKTIAESGQDHNKQFTVQVFIDEIPYEIGKGGSKKDAEQKAAQKTLQRLH